MSLQGTLFPPPASWRPPRLSEMPADWRDTPRLSLDTETCDPLLKKLGPGVRRGGFIAGVSLALGEDRGHYLPLRHLGGDNVEDPDQALAYVRHQAARYDGEVVGANLGYDLDYLAEVGVHFPLATFRDVQVAEPLLDELQFSYSLDNILLRHGLPQKDEALLREAAAQFRLDPKAELWKLPARYVGAYAEADATLPLRLLRKQEEEIEAQGLRRIWDLESAVTPILVRMRRRGVGIDFDQLDRVERFSKAEEMKAWGEVQRHTGVSIRVGDAMKAEVVAQALRAAGIEPGRTAKGAPSITKEWLEALNHPVGALIRRARKMSQLRTTFVASVREHVIRGRIHCTFNQIKMQKSDDGDADGAAYGRLSCSDLNLQQQPARDPEIGPMWRKVYVPDPGGAWASLDYSQQEPGLALHFAAASGPARIGGAAHRSALEAVERKHNDPTMDYHTMFTAMVHGPQVLQMDKHSKELKRLRDPCKNLFLGIVYGMGGPKLCRTLGMPTKVIEHHKSGRRMEVAGDEGQALMDLVDSRVPYLRATARAVEKIAKERGYVVTLMGRRCRFPKDDYGNFDWTHKALNRIVQGSAADQMKLAMIEMDRDGAPLQLQVHDEVDLTTTREDAQRYARIMIECLPLRVPVKVDLEMGPSWGEIK